DKSPGSFDPGDFFHANRSTKQKKNSAAFLSLRGTACLTHKVICEKRRATYNELNVALHV
ncbi:hypothetical protein, partial [Sutterella massiliensis]|uniref:hypothetical protein n=1 Tax=Sutterella massiliensis TaxID=1816689 RepID=UPI00196078F1